MKGFHLAYRKVAQAVRQLENLPVFPIPWGHNIAIFQQLKTGNERLWYASMTIAEGWSRSALLESILSKLSHCAYFHDFIVWAEKGFSWKSWLF